MNRRGFLKTIAASLSAFVFKIATPREPRVLLVTNNPLHSDWVRSGYAYDTVNGAMRDANFGDTVLVHPGMYNESVTVKRGVTLDGFKGHTSFGSITVRGTLNLV